jgi:putative transposase
MGGPAIGADPGGIRTPRAPAVVTTDKLRSYGAGFSELGLAARHEQGLRKNSRAEVSHQPARRWERGCSGSSRAAQRFASVHSAICGTFNMQRHLISRRTLRIFRANAIVHRRAAAA